MDIHMKNGEFPKGVKLGKRAVGWPATVIDEWIKKKIKAYKQKNIIPFLDHTYFKYAYKNLLFSISSIFLQIMS